MRSVFALLAGLLILGHAPQAVAADCRQALALGLDVSGSVDRREYHLQLTGLAAALTNPEVRHALLASAYPPVQLAVFEWSGPDNQRLLQDWVIISDEAALLALAARLRGTKRAAMDPSTALGTAKQYGGALLRQKPDCWRRTLDISGDGMANTGPLPRDIKLPDWATVNALVIGADPQSTPSARQPQINELSSYFQAWVIQGPDAFVETALGFADYERAMVRKLKRELQGLSLATSPVSPAVHTWNTKSAQYQRTAVRSTR